MTSGAPPGRAQFPLEATEDGSFPGDDFGLVKCASAPEDTDGGGPLFEGSDALGLTSGGSGDCSSGGTTFFQPVTEPLQVFGVEIY